MTRTNTVDILLDRCNELEQQRGRAIAQRAGYESHLWYAETLLKRIATLLPRLIAETPADGVARDTIHAEIVEFINEPRHHPGLSDGSDEGEAELPSDTEEDGHVDV